MNRQELTAKSESYIKNLIQKHTPVKTKVYLYGFRARQTNSWNSDYDVLIDADISSKTLATILDELDESFVPFKVDIVTSSQIKGHFAEKILQEAEIWM